MAFQQQTAFPLASQLFTATEVIKTGDYTLVVTDTSAPLVANKATAIAFSLPAIASAGVIPYFIRNIGVGDLTIDPNGSETIEGATTLVLHTGESALIWPNGTLWRAMTILAAVAGAAGECRLSKVGANLQLDRYDGRMIFINGAFEQVPAAGVTLAQPSETATMTIASPCVVTLTSPIVAGDPLIFSTSGALPTGVTAGVVYYAKSPSGNTCNIAATVGGANINTTGSQSGTHKVGRLRRIYAYMSSGTMTLEWSSTVEAVDAIYGHKIKTGDATRTLVGLAFDSSTAWVDSAAQRFTLSWFNQRQRYLEKQMHSASASVTTIAEINGSGSRAEFLTWGDRPASAMFGGQAIDTALSNPSCYIFQDGIAVVGCGTINTVPTANYQTNINTPIIVVEPTEGYHYFSPFASTDAGTLTFTGGASANSSYTRGWIWG